MIRLEPDIIERCRKGERKAQMQLYSLYYKRVYNSCYRILRNSLEAEDAMQESFLKVFSKLDKFQEEANLLEAWIVRIAINTSIDKLRKNELEFTPFQEGMEYSDSSDLEEDDWTWIAEKAEQIKSTIEQLPHKYRLILTLHLIEGFDFEEIAEILKQKPGTVRVQFLRGKERLITLLQAS